MIQLIIRFETNIKCFDWDSYLIISFYLDHCFLVTKYLAIDNFEKYKQVKKNYP